MRWMPRHKTCGALIEAAEDAFGIRPRPRSRRRVVAAALTFVAATAAVATALALHDGEGPPTVVPDSLVKIDARTHKIVDVIPVGRSPDAIEVAGKYVFAASGGDGTLTRIDRRTGAVVTSGHYDAGGGLAWDRPHGLWVGSVGRGVAERIDTRLPPYDPAATPNQQVPLPPGHGLTSLDVRAGSLWIATATYGASMVERWRLQPLHRLARYRLRKNDYGLDVAYGYGAAWVPLGNPADAILRVDGRTGRARRISVGTFPGDVAAGFGSVWVTQWYDHAVRRLDPATGRTRKIVHVGNKPIDVAVSRDSIWVSNHCSGNVAQVDPRTNAVTDTIKTGLYPQWIAADDDFVWVEIAGSPTFEPCDAPQNA
jgi:YVTN family beta-propeller protein